MNQMALIWSVLTLSLKLYVYVRSVGIAESGYTVIYPQLCVYVFKGFACILVMTVS